MIEEILEEYRPLVRHIAKSACISSKTLDVDDLCQVGEMAVARAFKAYDPNKGGLKPFILRSVRMAIYNEAARFLGALTVDHCVTAMAVKASKSQKTDEETSSFLSTNRKIDVVHVQDLKRLYNNRRCVFLEDVNIFSSQEYNLEGFLDEIIRSEIEREVLYNRILGDEPIKKIAKRLSIPRHEVSACEQRLINRIKSELYE